MGYSITSGPASVSGNQLTITGSGSVTVQASQPGNANYHAATSVSQTFTVNQASQTIAFTQNAPAVAGYNTNFTVAATASSGLPVSFTSSGVCSNVGATFTMTDSTGTCTVTASQSGNANYLAAAAVLQTTTAAKATQIVAFTGAPATAVYQSTFMVTATTNSGITPTITATGVCTLAATTVTITNGTGTCTQTAKWAANTYYLAASAAQTTTAAKAVPSVTFTGAPTTAPYQATFSVAATSNSGITPTLTAVGACSISGTTATMTSGTGTCTTTAKWAANSYYLAASATQTTTATLLATAISWPTPAPITYPKALSATQLNATANIAGKFVYSPPSGSVLNAGLDTLSVVFTPTLSKNYATATASVVIQVNPAATTVVWSNPAPITSGTPLSAVQLDATITPVTVGSYVYTPPAGTVLNQGVQTLSVQFTPGSANYLSSTGSVSLQVNAQQGRQFEHVVIVVQENRTPDNLFGSNPSFEPGVDIATNGINSKHESVPFTPVPLAGCYDLGHEHAAFQSAYNNGEMNGSDKVTVSAPRSCTPGPNPQFRYVDNSSGTVQPYFNLATQYGFANRMFQTNQGPSFPAHQFLIAGTSAPTTDSTLFAANNPTSNSNGCVSTPGTTVQMIDPSGVSSTMYPCFDHGTLIDLLEGAGLSWRYYAATGEAIWTGPNAITKLCNPQVVNGTLSCTGSEWANVILKPAQVLTDVKNCKLANVAWVTPTGQNSDHAVGNNGGGPSWVASIVNAIGNSKCGYWQNTAILITWDDWGGWYDHVPPYRIGQSTGWGQSYVYGFRVPLLVVSAYTPTGYVSNANHDFGSMLRFVESNFGLGLIGPGTWADSYADDLMEFFPAGAPRSFNTIPSKFDAEHFIRSREKATPPDND